MENQFHKSRLPRKPVRLAVIAGLAVLVAYGAGRATPRTVEVPVLVEVTKWVDKERVVPFAVDVPVLVPGPVEYRTIEHKVFVLRDHKVFVPRHCPSVADALNENERISQ